MSVKPIIINQRRKEMTDEQLPEIEVGSYRCNNDEGTVTETLRVRAKTVDEALTTLRKLRK